MHAQGREAPRGSRSRAADSSGRARIVDVARMAGVSPATVSRVLTGTKPVSDSLSRRVKETVERLGYRPNPAAQGLLRGRSHTVGVVVPDLTNPYFAEALKGVTAAAGESGRQTLVADSDEDPAAEGASALELARWTDGLVLCSPRMSDADLRAVAAATPGLVCVNRVLEDPPVAAVAVDFRVGIRAICDHLYALGHRRVAYLQGPPLAWSEMKRQQALAETATRGFSVQQVPCGSRVADGYRAAEAALACEPTAILAFSDHVALGVISRLSELGMAVPGDVSVTGFDDIPLSEVLTPGLTTIAVAKPTLGRLAWQQLADPADGRGGRVITVNPQLVVRGSTGPPPCR